MVQFKFQHVKDLLFGGTTFCCCLPVRLGVILLSLLGVVFAGLLSLVLWFEVANGHSLTHNEITAFTVIALVETLLLVACLVGFVGAIVRKQLFIQIYAYFLYFHLLLNIGVALYLLWLVNQFSTSAAYHACIDAIKDTNTQQQCVGFLQVARGIYFAVSTILILIEMYAAIVVARYVNQIQGEKRESRSSRVARAEEHAYRMNRLRPKDTSYSVLQDSEALISPGYGFSNPHSPGLSRARFAMNDGPEFNPYEEVDLAVARHASVSSMPPEEMGYGGGSWTHSEIAATEKERLQDEEDELDIEEQRRREIKTEAGPPTLIRVGPAEDLPRYSVSDPH